MKRIIAVRREDKNKWERRAPLIPADVAWLRQHHKIRVIVQPSPLRVFSEEQYRQAGAEINEDLSAADCIFAVKEIPEKLFQRGKTYVFFSHTIKGQPYNMPMLQRMMELECNLIDYERIANEKNQRLIFFGPYAGLAGMVETLHALGQKLSQAGIKTPFARIKQAYQYPSLAEAKREIAAIGEEIGENGFTEELCPLVVAFAGYGNVARGAQEIFDLLPHKVLSPDALLEMAENFSRDRFHLYKVIFKEEDMVRPRQGNFELQDYYQHPEKYEGKFERYLEQITVLVNGIYWTSQYPRLVSRDFLRNQVVLDPHPKLQVIGDISCDINGSIEITVKSTEPDEACFTYFPGTDGFQDGIHADGITVMAVENLPCEFPAESSTDFSRVLREFVPQIMRADFSASWSSLDLPGPIKKAAILQRGQLTETFQYLQKYLQRA